VGPQIDAIVLAAGLSTRAMERNKLLLPLAETTSGMSPRQRTTASRSAGNALIPDLIELLIPSA
jgi:CTP:molybdopterin cytidylyltransferase MocA